MHMADALISPAAGGVLWAVSAGAIAYCSKKVRAEANDQVVPLMGVLGAFLFAAQMINFTIPATGSSGHLGGGILLAILLGPYAAFLTIASVIFVQALFFADGGILALGCNIFNMGFWPAFVVYPLVYKTIIGSHPSQARLAFAAIISAVIGMQLGAFSVVLETVASDISSLPFATFVLLMQPIHLAIGIVEGLVTASVVACVYQARPETIQIAARPANRTFAVRGIALAFLTAALLTGGIFSWYASQQPDGLEWSLAKATGTTELQAAKGGVHELMASLQKRVAFLPDYSFKKTKPASASAAAAGQPIAEEGGSKLGRSVAGIVGGTLTLAIAAAIGFVLRRRGQSA